MISMDDDDISLISQMFWMSKVLGSGNNSGFVEGNIEAMQKGIELDASKVQKYFLQYYK